MSEVTVEIIDVAAVDVEVGSAPAAVDVSAGIAGADGLQGPAGPAGPAGTFATAQEINAQSSSYTLQLSDAGKLINVTAASGTVTITVPASTAVAFATGTHIDILASGNAAVSVVGASGVTVNATPGTKLRAAYSTATLICVGVDAWVMAGDISS